MKKNHTVQFIKDIRIPMSDGITLSAALWLPEGNNLPCVIDMLPYRWRDWIADRDQVVCTPLAAQGIACLRIDVRGTGESGGAFDDEYTEQQVKDFLSAIDWVIAQTWSNKKVAAMGNSWGGFAALGALKAGHPALKAGIVSCASDDGYTDDAHFESGVILSENFLWGTYLVAFAAQPTDPTLSASRGEDWEDVWKQRLEALRFYPSEWVKERSNKSYRETRNFRDVKVPVLLAGGWLDAYIRGQWRLSQAMGKKSCIVFGGHAHGFPQLVRPDLCIDFDTLAGQFLTQHLCNAPAEKTPDISFIYTHIPSNEYPQAKGFWITLTDRHQINALKLGKPILISAPTRKDGFIQSFGKWCASGNGGDEAATYPSSPAVDINRSWVYKFHAFNKDDVFLGTPCISIKDASAFAGGVYLLRLFLCKQGHDPKRIAYAVIDGRNGNNTDTILLSPFGFQAQQGDWLEAHILPQAWPLLWAPYPTRSLPPDLLTGITMHQPAQWQRTDIPPAPNRPKAEFTPGQDTQTYEEKDGVQKLHFHTPYQETALEHALIGEGMDQHYTYRPSGEMSLTIKYKTRMHWPKNNEDAILLIDMTVDVKNTDMLTKMTLTAFRNDKEIFQKTFEDNHTDALLPP